MKSQKQKQKQNEFVNLIKDTTKKILLANLDIVSCIHSEYLELDYNSSDPKDPEGSRRI